MDRSEGYSGRASPTLHEATMGKHAGPTLLKPRMGKEGRQTTPDMVKHPKKLVIDIWVFSPPIYWLCKT